MEEPDRLAHQGCNTQVAVAVVRLQQAVMVPQLLLQIKQLVETAALEQHHPFLAPQ